jgi:uncharacterized damage-inducible protein DinB
MEPFFADYQERLQTLHRAIDQVLATLPQEALDWKAGAAMNSVAVLVAHVAGSEQFWIGDMTVRGATARVRAKEFETGNLDKATLQAHLDAALADSAQNIAQLNLGDLERLCAMPYHGQIYTIGWALLHALEHIGIHVGHLEMIKQLWEQQETPLQKPSF